MQRNQARIAALTAYLFFLTTSFSAQNELQPGDHIPGELIVMFFDAVDAEEIGIEQGMELTQELSNRAHIYLYEVAPGGEAEMLSVLRADGRVQAAQLNHVVADRATVPNDPLLDQQWHHVESGDHDIDSDEAWDVTTGGTAANGARIVVCVLEGGGTNYAHNDLVDNHWTNANEIDGNGVDDDSNGFVDDYNGWNATNESDNISAGGHGTSVSGMIGATGDNGVGGVGVNWDVEIMQVQMGGLSESNVIAAYNYPLEMRSLFNESEGASGAFVVATNASWGIDLADPANYPVWCGYYDDLGAAGILNCGATANQQYDIDTQGDMPTGCSSDYMVSVTATNNNDVRTFSAYGITTIDLGAPGDNVYLPSGSSAYNGTSGTSFASPCVAGAIALVYSAPCPELMELVMSNPQGGADLVLSFILDGVDVVDNLVGETVTGGRLNVANSVGLALANCGPIDCTPMSLDASMACVYDANLDTVWTEISLGAEMSSFLCSTDSVCWAVDSLVGGVSQGLGAWTCDAVALSNGDVQLYSGLQPGSLYGFYFAVDSLISDTLWVETPTCDALMPGCTDMDALNYDAAATIENGSCVFPCVDFAFSLTTDCWPDETGWTLVGDDGELVAEVTAGTYSEDAQTYTFEQCLFDACYTLTITDTYGDGLDGSSSAGCDEDGGYFALDSSGATVISMDVSDFAYEVVHQFCLPAIFGCTDMAACNFDEAADTNDNSCIYIGLGEISGPTNPTVGDTVTYTYDQDNPETYLNWDIQMGDLISGQGTDEVIVVWGDGETGFDGTVSVSEIDSLLGCWGGMTIDVTVDDFIDDIAQIVSAPAPCMLWPNPASLVTRIDFGSWSGSVDRVELFDARGLLIKSWSNIRSIEMDISLANQPSGLYQVRIFSADFIQVLPVVVKH